MVHDLVHGKLQTILPLPDTDSCDTVRKHGRERLNMPGWNRTGIVAAICFTSRCKYLVDLPQFVIRCSHHHTGFQQNRRQTVHHHCHLLRDPVGPAELGRGPTPTCWITTNESDREETDIRKYCQKETKVNKQIQITDNTFLSIHLSA